MSVEPLVLESCCCWERQLENEIAADGRALRNRSVESLGLTMDLLLPIEALARSPGQGLRRSYQHPMELMPAPESLADGSFSATSSARIDVARPAQVSKRCAGDG